MSVWAYSQDLISLVLILIGFCINRLDLESRIKQFYFLFLIVQGISILILNFKIKPYLGVFIAIMGFYLLESSLSQYRKDIHIKSVFSKIFGWSDSFLNYFVYVGFSLIILEIISIRFFFNNYLGDTDMFGLVLGVIWIVYPYIPNEYSRERDFIFLFLNTFFIIIIIPALLEITPLANDNYFEAKENWIEKFVTLPLVSILQFLGYYSFADGNKVYYTNISLDNLQSVYIAPMCSGIYSIQVFFSAFGSYLLVFQKKIGRDILPIFLLGLLMSYTSNLLRLVMVILAGHYYG